jgi:hypothetical protein
MVKRSMKKATKLRPVRSGRGVRLDLTETDHERLERIAGERGPSKASYARMAVLECLKADVGTK